MNSDELRHHLRPRLGGPLPKDRRLDHSAVADFPLRYRRAYQRVERGILHACTANGAAPEWQVLALKVANCTPRRPCREAAICWWCKTRMGLAEAEAMVGHFPTSARRRTISVITIILAVVPLDEVDEARSLVKAFPRYWRRLCRTWPGCRWRGRVELDLLTGHPKQELGQYARKTLLALDYHPEKSAPSIGIHAHVVLHHPGISRSRVAGYRGAQGAEVGLLLRRLRERLGISQDRFQVICASASFSEEGRASAGNFGAQLAGVPPETFVPVTGTLATRTPEGQGSAADANALAAVDLSRFYADNRS